MIRRDHHRLSLATILILLFVATQLLSCSHSSRSLRQETAEQTDVSSTTSTLSAIPPSRDNNEDDDIDPLYGVSKRLVPGGPNPLHN
ncbi:hypothetical protein Sjap_005020 [Stephania japonica]|uniref:Uncharacterized protein n=1 Tax=Stephania japonica TaxID=461633 RepID=A0AAP0PIC3_9MAGN